MPLSVTLPTFGETGWDAILNTAFGDIVTAVNANEAGLNPSWTSVNAPPGNAISPAGTLRIRQIGKDVDFSWTITSGQVRSSAAVTLGILPGGTSLAGPAAFAVADWNPGTTNTVPCYAYIDSSTSGNLILGPQGSTFFTPGKDLSDIIVTGRFEIV